jgi:hypothetical protein
MRECAFCQGAPAVRAPILPDWLRQTFPGERVVRASVACKRCRRGWIPDVERDAMPVLKRLIAGTPFIVSQQNQGALALWSAKTILTLQAAQAPATFSAAVYRHTFERREPPTGFRLALGLRPREGGWPYRFAAQGFRASNGRPGLEPTFPGMVIDSYRAGLCIGHLVIRAAATFEPCDVQLIGDTIEPATLPIWPLSAPACWPPEDGLVRMTTFESVFQPEPAALLARAA